MISRKRYMIVFVLKLVSRKIEKYAFVNLLVYTEKSAFLGPNFTKNSYFQVSVIHTDSWTNIRPTDIIKYPGYPLSWISVLETLLTTLKEVIYDTIPSKPKFV